MASCTNVFTGLLLTAGVDAPAIEYLMTGNQLRQDIRQRYPASMPGEYFAPISMARLKLHTLPAVAVHAIPRLLIVGNSAIGGVKEFAIDTGDEQL